MRVIVLFLILISSTLSAQKKLDDLLKTYNTHSIPYISVEELRMRQLNDTVVILDAREKEEYEVSHIPSAIWIGFREFSPEKTSALIPDKNTQIIVYCSVGIRSEKIAGKIKKAGFAHVKNLYGGIFEWKNSGYPIFDNFGKETENVHTFSKMWRKYLHAGNPVY